MPPPDAEDSFLPADRHRHSLVQRCQACGQAEAAALIEVQADQSAESWFDRSSAGAERLCAALWKCLTALPWSAQGRFNVGSAGR